MSANSRRNLNPCPTVSLRRTGEITGKSSKNAYNPSRNTNIDISSIDYKTSSSLKVEYEEILTSEEAAKYLKLSIGSLRNMTSNGLIPYQKLGGRNRYFKEDLRNLLLANRRGGSNGY